MCVQKIARVIDPPVQKIGTPLTQNIDGGVNWMDLKIIYILTKVVRGADH